MYEEEEEEEEDLVVVYVVNRGNRLYLSCLASSREYKGRKEGNQCKGKLQGQEQGVAKRTRLLYSLYIVGQNQLSGNVESGSLVSFATPWSRDNSKVQICQAKKLTTHIPRWS